MSAKKNENNTVYDLSSIGTQLTTVIGKLNEHSDVLNTMSESITAQDGRIAELEQKFSALANTQATANEKSETAVKALNNAVKRIDNKTDAISEVLTEDGGFSLDFNEDGTRKKDPDDENDKQKNKVTSRSLGKIAAESAVRTAVTLGCVGIAAGVASATGLLPAAAGVAAAAKAANSVM